MHGFLSRQFHKQTNFNFPLGTLPTDPQYWPKEWTEIYHKSYPRMPKVPLSEKLLDLGELKNALELRFSQREFDITQEISFSELSTLLHFSSGIRPSAGDNQAIRRFYPSGGARYPLEVYLLVQRVEGLTPGIYHFNVKNNYLEILDTEKEDVEELKKGLLYPWSQEAAVVVFITAVWGRNFMKYKDRGYRIVLMEAGHLNHNIALISSALGIKCCNSVGFHNEHIDHMLDIGQENEENSLYMAVLGK